jgi:hypothetical protein
MKQQILHLFMGSTGALVISAAARALPVPVPMGNKAYAWFYRFAHILLANFDKANSGRS